ncbi:PLP-dependent aminotransferase family protein [Streptacidiphilus sp. MAP5-3]|uniref:MocR-like transcription factor YczR n=1 Tax=unclassified Streptacidiphilus TaxID=2643834 RepID=UPI0035171D68
MVLVISSTQIRRIIEHWQRSGTAYSDLADAIRIAVIDGRIPLGARIPAERVLSSELEISRNTVTTAYRLLRETGYLESRQGAGSFVTIPPDKSRPARSFSWTAASADGDIDFTTATLSAPEPMLVEATWEAAAHLRRHTQSPGYDLVGIPALREALADRMTRQGLPTTPDQIMVTAGAQHAWHLLLQHLSRPHDRILLDSPTYPAVLDSIRAMRRRSVPVGLSSTGWDVDLLDKAIRQTKPALAYLMPDFHNPTGAVMPRYIRTAIADAARVSGTFLVIDETLRDLSLDDTVLPAPMSTYGASNWAITIGSLSKTCWGGLRLGWLRAAPSVISALVGLRGSTDSGNPIITQLTACLLLEKFDDLLSQRQAMLTTNRQGLVEALGKHLPDCTFTIPAGGLSLWVDLGARVSSRLALAAPQHGVQLLAGPRFGGEGTLENRTRLPFVHDPATAEEGVRRIAAALRDITPQPAASMVWGAGAMAS